MFLYPASALVGPWYLDAMPGENSAKVLAFFVAGLLLLTASVGSVAHKVWYGEQRGYLANAASVIASVVSTTALWFGSRYAGESAVVVALVALLGPASVVNLIGLVGILHRTRSSQSAAVSVAALAPRAGKFFGLAVIATSILSFDYLLISQILTAEKIVIYSVSTRIFDVINLFYTALLLALWPSCTEALARRDWAQVFAYLRRYLFVGVCVVCAATLALVWMMDWVVAMLSPTKQIAVPLSLILLLGALTVAKTWTNTFAMVLQSMSAMKALYVVLPLQAIINVAAQLLLAPRYGLQGVTLGILASYVLTTGWVVTLEVMRQARQATAREPLSELVS